jgi:putative transcriptional regulator
MQKRHAPGLLLAAPSLQDPNFQQSVILLFHHDEDGATGIIINRPTREPVGALLDSIGAVARDARVLEALIGFGGPVGDGIGWVVFEGEEGVDESFLLDDDLRVSGSRAVLDELLVRVRLDRFLFVMGYAGWGPGQLDEEIKSGSWLPIPVDREILFEVDSSVQWRRAYQSLGIEPDLWLGPIGNA